MLIRLAMGVAVSLKCHESRVLFLVTPRCSSRTLFAEFGARARARGEKLGRGCGSEGRKTTEKDTTGNDTRRSDANTEQARCEDCGSALTTLRAPVHMAIRTRVDST